jgi:hypothetical protein
VRREARIKVAELQAVIAQREALTGLQRKLVLEATPDRTDWLRERVFDLVHGTEYARRDTALVP